MAVNCSVAPTLIEGVAGVTAIDVSVAAGGVTVNVVEPEILPEVAVIVVAPAATADARPEPLMVAMFVADDDQLAVVRVALWPSLYVPVAVNCCVAPWVTDGLLGDTDNEVNVTVGLGVGDELPPPPPQAMKPENTKRTTATCSLLRIGSAPR